MNSKELRGKAIDRAWELISDVGGGLISHWIVNKTEGGQPMIVNGKPVKMLDPNQVRAEAPHFAKKLEDEAEFNGLVTELDPGLQKSLEIWMANLGDHQRADVILTIVEMLARRKMPDDLVKARVEAVKVLEQLAEATPDVFKTRRAVAFRLMKASESDYLGAQFTEQASAALVYLIAEFRQGKTDWDTWANARAVEIDTWTQGMRTHLTTRPRGFIPTLRRLFDLPWDRN